jgi:hypothetical protein
LFLRLFLLASNGFPRTFTGAGIGFGFLAPHGQSPTMTQAPIATKIHESLDMSGNLPSQVTLNLATPIDNTPDLRGFLFSQVVSSDIGVNAGFPQDIPG